MKEKYIYMIGAAVAIVLVCMILSVLFPAKAVAETEVNTIEPETAGNDIMDAEIAEKPQNRQVNGRIAVNTPNALNVLEALERERNEQKAEEENAGEEAERNPLDDTRNQSTWTEGEPSATEAMGESDAETCSFGSREDVQLYSVNGEILNPDLQRYLYSRLQEFNCEWFFRYALCQIYQESRFNAAAENPNGLDKGLCQFRIPYFPAVAEEAGLVEYDVFSPIDSIYVYTYLMCKYLNETEGDVAMSLSLYRNGYGGAYSAEYVRDVTRWFNTVEEVKR